MTKLRGASSGVFSAQLERLFGQGTTIGVTEGELLERFVSKRDESAFEALVARHGPMVLNVCRQVLRDPNDVDDAFQATFLVLVKKAGTLRRRELLGNWLYGVAYKVASRARAMAARRTARVWSGDHAIEELAAAASREASAMDPASITEQSPWLHKEVSHLPDKYRTAILLCYFEGLTHDEAALRLGWPIGTVKGRLARARELLRRRLTRRGVTLSAAALASQLALADCRAAVPASLQLATTTAARSLTGHVGASLAATSVISVPVSALVEGVLEAMFASQLKTVAIPLVLVAGTFVTGITVGATQLGQGAGPLGQGTPTVPKDMMKVQGRSPRPIATSGPIPVDPKGSAPLANFVHEMDDRASPLFDRLLSAVNKPSREAIERLAGWSSLTLQADQLLNTSSIDRARSAQAHRDRISKLHHKMVNLAGEKDTQGITKLSSIKLREADDLLAHEKQRPADDAVLPRPDALVVAENPPAAGLLADSELPTDSNSLTPSGGMAMAGAMPMAGMRGALGMRGGMMRGAAPRPASRQIRTAIAGLAAELAVRETDPKNKAIFKLLDQPIEASFADQTPLDDVLKHIKQATTTETYPGIPIYVDPKGLEEASATTTSPVVLDLQGVPLKTSLRLILKQIGLAYCVRDGVLIISSVEGINEELSEAQTELEATAPYAGGRGMGGGMMGPMGGGMR